MRNRFAMGIVVTMLLAAPVASAIESCKKCVMVEVRQQLCACVDDQFGDVMPISCSQSCMIGQTKLSQTVTTEDGWKCKSIPDSLVPSTIMAGGTSSFQNWWNMFVEATSGSGSSGPANSYYADLDGTTSCYIVYPGYTMSTGTTSWGATYSIKTYNCQPSGQSCYKTVYIYGTDGE